MVIRPVPAPSIQKPAVFKKFCKSTISGSLAGLYIVVLPGFPTANSIIFSVAPTLG